MNALTEMTDRQLDALIDVMRQNQLPGLAKFVYEAVEARGQFEGDDGPFKAEALVARQLCKLTEELGEASEEIDGVTSAPSELMTIDGTLPMWEAVASNAGEFSAIAFKNRGNWWNDYQIDDLDAFATELADVAIPLFCLMWIMWEKYDVDIGGLIIDKVVRDIKRGV